MDSGGRAAKTHMARAKAYFQRHEVLRAVEEIAAALFVVQGGSVTGPDKLAVESALREMVALLNRTDELKACFPKGIAYKPGFEKPLHNALVQMVRLVRQAQERETYTQTLERKQKLDKLLSYGRKLLEAGKVQDADGAFQEAADLYVDEHSLFRLMGEACLAARQPRMASKYLKRAVKVERNPKLSATLLVRSLEESGNIPAARKLEAEFGLK